MDNKNFDIISKKLHLTYNLKIKKDSTEKTLHNIDVFSQFNRDGLKYREKERRILIYSTTCGEKIWVQYPGKETIRDMPWDFRPKIYLNNNEAWPDLSFKDVWDDLIEIGNKSPDVMNIIAALLFRMAFMIDYKKDYKDYYYEDIDVINDSIVQSGIIRTEIYSLALPLDVIDVLQNYTGKIRGVSLEGYLIYNDLMAQNEDCKYYYKNVYKDYKKWDSSKGRINTLLTHISIIEYIQGRSTFSNILSKFQRGRGIAPIPLSSIEAITNGIIVKNNI